MPSPSAALRRSRAFALSATPEKLAGGGATTADYVMDIVSQPEQDNGGEHRTAPHLQHTVLHVLIGTLSVPYCAAFRVSKQPIACLRLRPSYTRASFKLLVVPVANSCTSTPSPRSPHVTPPRCPVSEVRERWQVCNQLGGPRATAIADSEKAKFMKFVPWAGVAARLSTTAAAAPVGGEGSKSLPPAPRGAAYCFLPLPVQTGLPVHVNGYFELSSNRYGGGKLLVIYPMTTRVVVVVVAAAFVCAL